MNATPAFDYDARRHAMVVSQLRTSAVNDPRVVDAMARVERERFLPAAVRELAYVDRSLDLGGGRRQNAPLTTGRLVTEAKIVATDRVLLIGAAGGYTAAVVSMLARDVVAVEDRADLVAIAREALSGTANVVFVEGPLAAGAPGKAPFDVLIVDGAVEQVPTSLIEQVRPGGRIASGVIDRGVTRLAAGTRTEGGFGLFDFADYDCVELPGFSRPKGFRF